VHRYNLVNLIRLLIKRRKKYRNQKKLRKVVDADEYNVTKSIVNVLKKGKNAAQIANVKTAFIN